MTLSKTMVSAGVVTAVAVGSFAAVGAVNAHGGGNGETREALIEQIAADTGSDVATVEASFEAHRDAMHAEREEAKAAHLDSLVEDGTLTQEQRDTLETKFDELKAEKEALRDQDLSREEVRAAMEEARDELETWAEEQGIDLDDIKPERGEGFGRKGQGRHHDFGTDDVDDGEDDDSETDDVEES